MTASAALREGLRHAFSRTWPLLALFAAGAGELFAASAAAPLASAALDTGNTVILGSGAAGLFAGWVACRVARVVFLYAALRPEGEGLLRAAARAPGYVVLSLALELMVRAWWWTGLVATGLAYIKEAGDGAAAGPSLGLAVVLAGGPFLFLFMGVWTDLALARSAGRAEPFSVSLAEAARFLAGRLGAPIAIVAATGIARWLVEASGSGLAALAGQAASPRQVLAARVLAGLIAALTWAVLELWRLFALRALEMAPPEPEPAPPPDSQPVRDATPILDATLIRDATPILDATPIDAPGTGG